MPANPKDLRDIYADPSAQAREADQALVDSIQSQFPLEGKNFTMHVENVQAHPKSFTHADEKDAILKSKSLTYPITADVHLISKVSGKVVDTAKAFPIMDAFHVTRKHTLLYKGNNYIVSNQLQLLPGVYTRTRENTGELEAHYNTAKGASFKVVLDPKTQVFSVELENSANPIAPLLTEVFKVPQSEIEKFVPAEVWKHNIEASAGKEDKILKAFYQRMVYKKEENPTTEQMIVGIRESLLASRLHPETTEATLGKSFENIQPEVLLRTIRNLVLVHRGDRPEDNRDSLQFKRVQALPDYLRTRFAKDHESVRSVKKAMLRGLDRLIDPNNPKIRSGISSKPFNKVYSSYIQKSSLISTPSETNSIESVENVGKVTVLGPEEGGISDSRAVPMAARNIDPSHLGILDPARTPESGHAGIDQRFTITCKKDKAGRLYAEVKDNAGKLQYLSVHEMMTTSIGFPDTKEGSSAQAQVNGEMKRVPINQIKYWLSDPSSMYTYTTNLVPFLNSNHPGRLTMAGKAIPQALSLVDREAPLVQTVTAQGHSFVKALGETISTTPEIEGGGVVTKVTNDVIHVKSTKTGETVKVQAVKNLPFNMKGFYDDETPLVKEGDKVESYQPLFENNYTKGGVLALGKNLSVAYMPYKGYNHEDGIVISEGAAKGLASHQAYKVDYDVTPETVARKALLARYFPGKFTKEQLDKLDDSGYAKVGMEMVEGDPVYAVLERREPSPEDRILGRLHKSLVNPYRLVSEPWNHNENGSVVDAHTDSKAVRIIMRSIKQLEVGDKLTGLHGNKGVVSLVLPDHKMPFNKVTGKPVDLVLNPASVTSRINLGQLMETAASKIAEKTGKPYMVKNFDHGNNLKTITAELKKHGLSDTDELMDPETNKSYGQIFGGKQYILKLYKTTDSNASARSVGGYDNVMQPTKGGEEGSKSVGYMEMLGLLGSDARHNLREISTLKSENNEEFWSKFIRGEPLPKPKMTFATKKFFDYLQGAGIKVHHDKGYISAAPITDHDILSQSSGAILKPTMLDSKNLEPEEGGLFDYSKTGGLRGDKWSHYKLAEPMVNPVTEGSVKTILGLKGDEFDNITSGQWGVKHGGDSTFHIYDTVSKKLVKEIKI